MTDTDETLLDQLRRTDAHEAWRLFCDNYWAAILRYGRKLGLSANQAQDVLQETMVALMRILPGFNYDRQRGRFRNFLLTIVHRRALATLRRARNSGGSDTPVASLPDPAIRRPCEPDAEALQRWRESLAEDSLSALLAQGGLDERTIAVFQAYVIENQPAAAVAAAHGLTENAVYQIKNRLLRRLQADVRRRLRDGGETIRSG